MKGATSGADGEIGLVPKPTSGDVHSILTGDGIWNSLDTIIDNSEKYTALKTFIDNMPIIRAGTLIFKNESGIPINGYAIFKNENLNEMFGVTNASHTNSFLIFMNGDHSAGLVDRDFYTYYTSSGGGVWEIKLTDERNINIGAEFRVNYIAAYFGKRS